MYTVQQTVQVNTPQQHSAPITGYQTIPSNQQQQNPTEVRMNGVDFNQSYNPSLPLVKPEAFLQYKALSRISEKNIGTQPPSGQPQLQQQSITNNIQAAAVPGQAPEWPLDLISAAFRRFGHTIVLNAAQWDQVAANLFKNADPQEKHPALDPTLTWHKLTAPPIVSRYAANNLTDEQQAIAVVAKMAGAGLLTRLPLDKAFVIATLEFLLSLTMPVSKVATEPLLVKCHHCGAPTVTRVEHVRGGATWGCMYLMCMLWLPCVSVMFWNNESWMNKRHYCSVCGKQLALWERMKGRRERGIKVYTQWGSFRLQPGEELASYVQEV